MPRYSTEFDESNAELDKIDLTLSDFELAQIDRAEWLKSKGFYDFIPPGMCTGFRLGSNEYDAELAASQRAMLKEHGLEKMISIIMKEYLENRKGEKNGKKRAS